MLVMFDFKTQSPKYDFKTSSYKMSPHNFLTFLFFPSNIKINELVDAKDLNMGAWFEAQIVNVTKTEKTPKEENENEESAQEEILYHVKYEE